MSATSQKSAPRPTACLALADGTVFFGQGFGATGVAFALAGGALGAIGAVCIIWAFRAGGVPNYVMPLVFGGAPVVNVLFSMYLHPPKAAPNPLIWVGFVLVAVGASLVLYYKPQS